MKLDPQTLEAQIKSLAMETGLPGRFPSQTRCCPRCHDDRPVRVAEYERANFPGMQFQYFFSYCHRCHPELPALVAQWDARKREVAAERAKAEPLRNYRRARRDAGAAIGRCYSHCSFNTFRPWHPSQAEALDQVMKWASDPAARGRRPFLLLSGEPGAGKTHLAVSVWREIARWSKRKGKLGRLVPFYDDAELYAAWRQSLPGRDVEFIQAIASEDLLIWDDVGKTVTDKWQTAMFAILNARMKDGRPTLFTSNFKPSALCARLEPSLARRIASGLIFEMFGAQSQAA